MKLSKYNMKDILLSAIKSELDSKEVYSLLADHIENAIISDKLKFLAEEEVKHKQFIEKVFKNQYPQDKIEIPAESIVPLPEVEIRDTEFPVEEIVRVLKQARQAEKAASDFYRSFAKMFDKQSSERNMLQYFSQMEMGHFQLIDIELENMERMESMESGWSGMMNIGP